MSLLQPWFFLIYPIMHSRSAWARKWRRFSRKFGAAIVYGLLMLAVLALVGGIMYGLTSASCRPRW